MGSAAVMAGARWILFGAPGRQVTVDKNTKGRALVNNIVEK